MTNRSAGYRLFKRSVFTALGCLLLVHASAEAQWPSDPWLTDPVDDETFATYRDFFRYDADLPFATEVFDVETVNGIDQEHLRFQSTAGEHVYAYLYRPRGRRGTGRPAVLFLHGGNAQGKAAAHYRALAVQVVRAGFDVLAIDMQHFGERNTGLLTTFTEEEKHDHLYNQAAAYLSWVVQTVKDAGRAYDFLVRERGADADRVALVGYSRGGQVGAIVGGVDQRFSVVSLLLAGHFDRSETEHRGAACPANYIGRISPRPLFLLNGEFDSDYDRERSVEPLHRLAGEPKEIVWGEMGHSVLAEHVVMLTGWLRGHLQPDG